MSKPIDVAKIAKSVSRPGIDPRMFVDVGVVSAVAVDAEGVHVDVATAFVEETAQVSPPYAGPGYGLHLPVDLDEAVVLAVPDGKYNAGARVVGRTWDRGAPPPDEVIEHPDDVALVIKPGQTVRIIVSDGGEAVIEARGSGKVRLGSESADKPPLTVDDGERIRQALQAAIIAQTAAPNPTGVAALQAFLDALDSPLIAFPTGAAKVLVE